MTTCATKDNLAQNINVCNLILTVPDTDFRDFLKEADELVRFAPEIIAAIENDMDVCAKKRKSLRLADKRYYEKRMDDLPGIDIIEKAVLADDLQLEVGRPRMQGYAVYMFLMIRGFLGSLSSKPARRFLWESMSLYFFLQDKGIKMPAVTTISENVNIVSHTTRELIFDRQIAYVLGESLDDFKQLTIDSTAVKANSSWPTDSKILIGLLSRASRLGQKLHLFEVENFAQGWVPKWLGKMDKLDFQIQLVAGKTNSKSKLKKHYRKLLEQGRKSTNALTVQFNKLDKSLSSRTHAPSRLMFLQKLVGQIRADLYDAERVIEYANNRVFHKKHLKSNEKVLSLSDGSAAYIQKGGRDAVIGYKPQLVRSENGFVTSLFVPQGNAADCSELVPSISTSIQRTGVVPASVSTDDGYASAKGRNGVLELGVKIISISGSKGKKLTTQENWESDVYKDARSNRSAVESLMFTIKNGFEFGEVGRRGLNPVRDELLEKVLAYNCCRVILLRKRQRKKFEMAS